MSITISDLTAAVTAITALLGALSVLVLQIVTLLKLNEERRRSTLRDVASSRRDATQAVILEHVNGLNDKIHDAAYAAGRAEGALQAIAPATASPTATNGQT